METVTRPNLVPLEPFPEITISVTHPTGIVENARVEFTEDYSIILTPSWFVPSEEWLDEFKAQGGHEQILHLLTNPPWKFFDNLPIHEPSSYCSLTVDGKPANLGDPVIMWHGGDEWWEDDYWVLSICGPGRIRLASAQWNDAVAMETLVSMFRDREYLHIMLALDDPDSARELIALERAKQLHRDGLLLFSDMNSIFKVLKSHKLLPRWSLDKHHGLLKSFILRYDKTRIPISIEIMSPTIPPSSKRVIAEMRKRSNRTIRIPVTAQEEWIRRAREVFCNSPGWYIVDNPTWRVHSAGAGRNRPNAKPSFSVTRVDPAIWATLSPAHIMGPRVDVSGTWYEES
jgi:hypothetical protein